MTALAGWMNFYVIAGSSAGALIGLQFVVITLIADKPVAADLEQASGAFATPTIVHFGTVLLLSAVLSAPWREIRGPAAFCGLVGICSLVYTGIVTRRLRVQTAYQPQAEDWLFHVILPLVAYATLSISAGAIYSHAREALFGVAAAVLLLLFTGIHNAWDAVTYHTFVQRRSQHH